MSENVGLVIKQLREERGISKSRLGREADVSNAYVVQIEQGDRSPSEDVLRRFAHVLRVPPHKLLIPAGMVDEEDILEARIHLHEVMKRCEDAGELLDEDEQDRIFAEGLGWADQWGAFDPRTREYGEPNFVSRIPSDEFWGWDKPLGVAPLEHWAELSTSDRRLVQRLANRLAQLEDSEDE